MRKISKQELQELSDFWGQVLVVWKPDYLNEAIIGISSEQKIIYSYNTLLDLIMEHESIDEDEARDFIDVNLLGAYIGENTPIIMDTEFYEYKLPFKFGVR